MYCALQKLGARYLVPAWLVAGGVHGWLHLPYLHMHCTVSGSSYIILSYHRPAAPRSTGFPISAKCLASTIRACMMHHAIAGSLSSVAAKCIDSHIKALLYGTGSY